jgi:glycine cleavage system H protein
MNNPENLRYAATHEWVRVEGETAVVGITDFAQAELGDVVYLDLPEAGRQVIKGAPFGAVESVKAVSDLYAPVSGEVVEINQPLMDAPEGINTSPYEGGWMLKIRMSDPAEVASLLDADGYAASAAH